MTRTPLIILLLAGCCQGAMPPAGRLVLDNWLSFACSLGDYSQDDPETAYTLGKRRVTIDFRDYAAALNPDVAVVWGRSQWVMEQNRAALLGFGQLAAAAQEWRDK